MFSAGFGQVYVEVPATVHTSRVFGSYLCGGCEAVAAACCQDFLLKSPFRVRLLSLRYFRGGSLMLRPDPEGPKALIFEAITVAVFPSQQPQVCWVSRPLGCAVAGKFRAFRAERGLKADMEGSSDGSQLPERHGHSSRCFFHFVVLPSCLGMFLRMQSYQI